MALLDRLRFLSTAYVVFAMQRFWRSLEVAEVLFGGMIAAQDVSRCESPVVMLVVMKPYLQRTEHYIEILVHEIAKLEKCLKLMDRGVVKESCWLHSLGVQAPSSAAQVT